MENGSGLGKSAIRPEASPAPNLLIELEPWHRVFFRNLADLLFCRGAQEIELTSSSGAFWPDVFVSTRVSWRSFLESVLYHSLIIAGLWGFSQSWRQRPVAVHRHVFDKASVIYYPTSEYLPPLNTGHTPARQQKGEPEYAKQPIISVPPESDNRTQTIVTPPDLKIDHDVPLPNIVAWAPTQMSVPLAATTQSAAQLTLPNLPVAVVAPPPELSRAVDRGAPALPASVIPPPPGLAAASPNRSVQAPQPAIVEPPPDINAASTSKIGDINIGHSEVIAPAPQLPVSEQHALGTRMPGFGGAGRQVVPPAPSLPGTGASNVAGRIIALRIRPTAVNGPIEIPSGNRRGTFAATPEGKPGAPGTPDIAADLATNAAAGNGYGSGAGNGKTPGSGGNANSSIPSGIYVGAGPNQPPTSALAGEPTTGRPVNQQPLVSSKLLATVTPPRLTSLPNRLAPSVPQLNATDLEKKVFGMRRFYSMALNMPNLNSAGGSWIFRFAELKEGGDKGELIAPVATQKVDPAYPAELMRENVEGTVTLYAVIHSDGTVGDVRVLRGVDERLNEFACVALSRWHFQPATKNGSAVALEAVVMIPFRARGSPF